MDRDFSVVDLVDSKNGRYIGQALYCSNEEECPLFTVRDRFYSGEMIEAFVEGAKQVGGTITLYHINTPVEINIAETPYNEIRNTVVKEMQIRSNRTEQ